MAQAAPTSTFELLQWNMIRAHDGFKAGLESITTRLADPPKDDMLNFLGYCEAWAVALEHHHDSEELTVFPVLNVKMNFAQEAEQHKGVHAFVDNFLAVVRKGQQDPASVDLDELRRLVDEGRGPLITHMDEEVEHIEASKLKVAGFTAAELKTMFAATEHYAKNNGDPFLVVPFMRSHTPPEFKASFPALPWLLTAVAIPYVLAMRHRGYWKYSPYAMS
ncbi:hypothetical protein PENSPDRAFT_632032 [Peniophora sp. CONT]|nr:hypothetical protein PENSPDRAFT_632032 [Peniophora sp. CONT]